jgi:uncharacterized membrane protein
MKTKAAIAGHPLHPALVAFPVAFYTATLLALIAYAAVGDPFWFRVALVANIGGVAMALIAAIPGAIDLFATIPGRSPARRTGLKHAAFNVGALVLFAISAGLLWGEWRDVIAPAAAELDATAPLVLSALGLACTGAAGVLGWKLVQTHHVGVDDDARVRTGTTQPLASTVPLRRHAGRAHGPTR